MGKWSSGRRCKTRRSRQYRAIARKKRKLRGILPQLKCIEELPSLSFLFTTSTQQEMTGREAGEDADGVPVDEIDPIAPVPAVCESGRIYICQHFE